jgi:sugar O-acyltransferase (sialic acid O-acetyltransferase NeuD family)
MSKGCIIIGFGGHSRLLIEILQDHNKHILGVTEINKDLIDQSAETIKFLGDDDVILDYSSNKVSLVNGLGHLPRETVREDIYNRFTSEGFLFTNLIHSSAIVSKKIHLETGIQILAGSIIQQGSSIGVNTIINTKVSIDHDSEIGNHCHIAPGVTVCGNVSIGDNSFIGAGTTIINNINIGKNCLVAAGSLIYKDIKDHTFFKNN